jgi:hypothetical protein
VRVIGATATFVPVSVVSEVRRPQPAMRCDAIAGRGGIVQLMLALGATLRIGTAVLDAAFILQQGHTSSSPLPPHCCYDFSKKKSQERRKASPPPPKAATQYHYHRSELPSGQDN